MTAALTQAQPELRRAWRTVLTNLEVSMNPFSFNTWLRGTEPLRAEGHTIVIEARHGADPAWLNAQLSCVVARAVEAVFGDGFHALFVASSCTAAVPAVSPPMATPPAGAARAGAVLGSLNRQYTFERYLPASGNKLALQACLDLLATAPRVASPVVMFGDPGLGKTHLLHALAARAASQGWSVACLSAETFTDRFQQALHAQRAEAVAEFQASVRSVNLLLIDDLQFFPGRPATVKEFANAIEAVTNAGGLIACASECNPDKLDLPPRLISRLKGGILAPMQPLNGADRRTYITVRAREERLSLPVWAIDAVAACEAPSIRVLQGAVNTTLALQRTGELDQATLHAHLGQFCMAAAGSPEALDTQGVIEAIAAHFAVTRDDLVGRGRSPLLSEARAVAMAVLLDRGRSLAQVAGMFANRHRSTVKDLGDRGRVLLESDPALRARLVPTPGL
ncbi:MAG TPA: DnaA/Hda family protein [Tepidiformaceae bacterium]|nr:DnaA/Hda family protein [Tepidiformaceae bacterium]